MFNNWTLNLYSLPLVAVATPGPSMSPSANNKKKKKTVANWLTNAAHTAHRTLSAFLWPANAHVHRACAVEIFAIFRPTHAHL